MLSRKDGWEDAEEVVPIRQYGTVATSSGHPIIMASVPPGSLQILGTRSSSLPPQNSNQVVQFSHGTQVDRKRGREETVQPPVGNPQQPNVQKFVQFSNWFGDRIAWLEKVNERLTAKTKEYADQIEKSSRISEDSSVHFQRYDAVNLAREASRLEREDREREQKKHRRE